VALLSERALLIVNPASRRGGRLQAPALRAFAAAGVQADAIVTEYAGHGGEVAQAMAESYDFIFTLGGDGTAMEVVDALAGTGRSVGILPGGTGNLLARALGIPLRVERAIPLLLQGHRRSIDLGVLGDGRHFAVAAGTGIDASMISGASSAARRRYGVLAYVHSATAAVLRRETFAVRATVDGKVLEMPHCVGAMIANVGSILNGLFLLGPGIRHDDGQLDLCLFGAAGPADMAVMMAKLARRDFRPDPRLMFARGTHVRIETASPRPAEADGELLAPTPLEATVAPGAAPLLVPRGSY
jgi:diacylglycerol kinase family enzyme